MTDQTDPAAGAQFTRLVEIMARLREPGGCPWDREQTFDTIKPYTLEETYEVLDAIERSAIRDKQVPVEVYQRMKAELPDYAPSQIAAWVQRFFGLWCRNQWKRERYAPSFHLDDENLDPKTWCRFPILSGGFDRELDELQEYVRAENEKG